MTKRRELTEKEKFCALRALRLQRASGLSQTELGLKAGGISQSAIAQYLNGKIPMNIPFKVALAFALKVDVDEIDPDLNIKLIINPEEKQLLENYRKSDDYGRMLTQGVAAQNAKIKK